MLGLMEAFSFLKMKLILGWFFRSFPVEVFGLVFDECFCLAFFFLSLTPVIISIFVFFTHGAASASSYSFGNSSGILLVGVVYGLLTSFTLVPT